MRDSEGRALPGMPTSASLPEVDGWKEPRLDERLFAPVVGSQEPGPGAGPEAPLPVDDRRLLQDLLGALKGVDPSQLDPAVMVHVHLTDAALATKSGIARIEGLGPATLEQVKSWLSDPQAAARIHLHPVLDTSRIRP